MNELLFIHAYSGCDSTSRIFGIGKKSAFQKLVKSDSVMKSCASAFIVQNKSQEDISELGKELMVDCLVASLIQTGVRHSRSSRSFHVVSRSFNILNCGDTIYRTQAGVRLRLRIRYYWSEQLSK